MQNDRLLEVREFEIITCQGKDKTEYGNYRIPVDRFEELENFIHDFSMTDDESDVLDFMKINYKRNVGDVISLKNYVGLIQMKNGYQIQVLPKISFAEGDSNNEKTKKIFLKMLRTLKDFPSKVFTEADLRVDKMNLYEIFINMYLKEVRQLVKRGIKSAYIEQEENLRYYKGKLLVSNHIKANMVHKERFYVQFDEFHVNRAENRIVKATLLKLAKITTSAENSKEIRQLLTAFEMVEPSTNYEKDFSKIILDRNTKDYNQLIKWSKVFLLNKSFTTFSGTSNSRSLLFPMETVYESYVAKHMKKALAPEGWSVSAQDRGHYLFVEPRRQFALRPDIVVDCGSGRKIIMDTKWKSLINRPQKNYGISQSDMYQMYAYAKKYGTSEIWLLYPLNDEMRGHSQISFDSGDGVTVNLHFVDVEHIEESLDELREKLILEHGS